MMVLELLVDDLIQIQWNYELNEVSEFRKF